MDFVNSDGSIDLCAVALDMIDALEVREAEEAEEQRKLDEQKRLMEELDEFDWGCPSLTNKAGNTQQKE